MDLQFIIIGGVNLAGSGRSGLMGQNKGVMLSG